MLQKFQNCVPSLVLKMTSYHTCPENVTKNSVQKLTPLLQKHSLCPLHISQTFWAGNYGRYSVLKQWSHKTAHSKVSAEILWTCFRRFSHLWNARPTQEAWNNQPQNRPHLLLLFSIIQSVKLACVWMSMCAWCSSPYVWCLDCSVKFLFLDFFFLVAARKPEEGFKGTSLVGSWWLHVSSSPEWLGVWCLIQNPWFAQM